MANTGWRKLSVFSVLPFFWAFFVPFSQAKEDDPLKKARTSVLNPAASAPDSLVKYHKISRNVSAPALAGEYAYILGYYGLVEESLYHLDRDIIAGPSDCSVRFYLSGLFTLYKKMSRSKKARG